MKIENRMQVKSWKQKLVLPAGVLCLALMASAPAQAKPDVPFVVDAIEKAQQAPTGEKKWQITANVEISSPTKPTMKASGVVTVSGDEEEGRLSGTLPMTIDGQTGGVNSLAFNLKRDGEVGIQWLIAGKAFLGRGMKFYQAIPNPGGEYLSRKIKWNGASRLLMITLTAEQVKVSDATPPKIRVPKTPDPPKAPIGKRYKLEGRLVLTNSEDGFLDNTCEIFGLLLYRRGENVKGKIHEDQEKNGRCVTIIDQDANKGFTLNFDKNIYLDHIFADPKTEWFSISSNIQDEDGGGMTGDNDVMSFDTTRWNTLAKSSTGGEHNLPGDRDSENVEVYYTVTFVKDLY